MLTLQCNCSCQLVVTVPNVHILYVSCKGLGILLYQINVDEFKNVFSYRLIIIKIYLIALLDKVLDLIICDETKTKKIVSN